MKKILFLTGTRADWGKLKALVRRTKAAGFDVRIFATGMHMLSRYGLTYLEIERDDYDPYPMINQDADTPQDRILANTIDGLSLYVRENRPDLIVIHGDRVEALAGAIVGNFNGILTAHIEGGELSGTLDGMIRHSITKLAHCHFCANSDAARRLVQLGEDPTCIFAIGSPDIDIMLSPDLPEISEVKSHYSIEFEEYGILIYHPVAGEDASLVYQTIRAALVSGMNFIAIYPNNDPGSQTIIAALDHNGWLFPPAKKGKIKIIPSMRFEAFLTLLKHAQVILGNSSAGIREAPVYGVPTVNVGSRQAGRVSLPSVVDVPDEMDAILAALNNLPPAVKSLEFGRGDSAMEFVRILQTAEFWQTKTQKQFVELVLML